MEQLPDYAVYTRDKLISLKPPGIATTIMDIPEEIQKRTQRMQRRNEVTREKSWTQSTGLMEKLCLHSIIEYVSLLKDRMSELEESEGLMCKKFYIFHKSIDTGICYGFIHSPALILFGLIGRSVFDLAVGLRPYIYR